MFTWLRYIPLFYFFLTLGKSIHGIHLIHQGDVRLSSTLNWSSRLDIYHRLYVHSQRHHPAIPSVSKISETSPPLSQCHRALMWSRILYLLPRTLLLHCQSHCFVYPLLGIESLSIMSTVMITCTQSDNETIRIDWFNPSNRKSSSAWYPTQTAQVIIQIDRVESIMALGSHFHQRLS